MRARVVGATRLLTTSTLLASLAASLLCGTARGDEPGVSKPFRTRAAGFAPIGKVFSLGEISINGRWSYGEQIISGGELLRASDDSKASVLLGSIGQVVLERGATLRLATAAVSTDGKDGHVLIVSLTNGNIRVQLQQDASAYLETCGVAFTSTRGASFHVETREGQAAITVSRGNVEIEPPYQEFEYIVEPVIADPLTGRPTRRASSTRRVPPSKPGAVQQETVSVKVSKKDKKTKKITPAGPGRKVTIALLTPGVGELGSQSVTVFTNDFGVATATFTAGPNPGETKIRATDDESGKEWVGRIVVAAPLGFWRTRNNILLGGAAAAIIIFFSTRGNRGSLVQQPPPMIP